MSEGKADAPKDFLVDIIKGVAVLLMVYQHTVFLQISSASLLNSVDYGLVSLATLFCPSAFLMMFGYGIGKKRSASDIFRTFNKLALATAFLFLLFFWLSKPEYQIIILANFALAAILVPLAWNRGRFALAALASVALFAPLIMARYGMHDSVFIGSHGNAVLFNMPLLAAMFPVFVGVMIRQHGMVRWKMLGLMIAFVLPSVLILDLAYKGGLSSSLVILGTSITLLLWKTLIAIKERRERWLSNRAAYYLGNLGNHTLLLYGAHLLLLFSLIAISGFGASYAALSSQDASYAAVTATKPFWYFPALFLAIMWITQGLVKVTTSWLSVKSQQ